MRSHHEIPAAALIARATGATATGALAVGAVAIGALALGALAVGALAIGRLAIGRARIHRLEIGDLTVRNLRVTERLEPPGAATSQVIVNIDVDDLAKAIDFYSKGLGLRLGRLLFEGSVAEMRGASSTIHILEKKSGTTAAPGKTAVRDYAAHWTPVHLDFEVEDIAAAVERAARAGATLENALETFSWGKLAVMRDPFGHGFCFIQMSARGYDAVT